MILYRSILILVMVLMVSGCSRFQETEVYQDHLSPTHNVRLFGVEVASPVEPVPTTGSILVVGKSEDAGMKRLFEDAFVIRLEEAGYKALPAYEVSPAYGESYFSEAMFRVRAERLNISHVVMTSAFDRSSETLFAVRSNTPLNDSVPIESTSSMRKTSVDPPVSDWPYVLAGRPRIKGDIVVIDREKGRKVGTINRDSAAQVVMLEAEMISVAKDSPVWSAKSEIYLLDTTQSLVDNLLDQYVVSLSEAQLLP
jgi:hypothetical protein